MKRISWEELVRQAQLDIPKTNDLNTIGDALDDRGYITYYMSFSHHDIRDAMAEEDLDLPIWEVYFDDDYRFYVTFVSPVHLQHER